MLRTANVGVESLIDDPDGAADNGGWNYRVIETTAGGVTFRAIHEFYYRDGVPNGHTTEPVGIQWDAAEGDEGGLLKLDRMRKALRQPVLAPQDFSTTVSKK